MAGTTVTPVITHLPRQPSSGPTCAAGREMPIALRSSPGSDLRQLSRESVRSRVAAAPFSQDVQPQDAAPQVLLTVVGQQYHNINAAGELATKVSPPSSRRSVRSPPSSRGSARGALHVPTRSPSPPRIVALKGSDAKVAFMELDPAIVPQPPPRSPRTAICPPRHLSPSSSYMSPREKLLQAADVGPRYFRSSSGADPDQRTQGPRTQAGTGLSPRSHVRHMKDLSESVAEQYDVVKESSADGGDMPSLDAGDSMNSALHYSASSCEAEDASPQELSADGDVQNLRQSTPILPPSTEIRATITRPAIPASGVCGDAGQALAHGVATAVDESTASKSSVVSFVANVLPPLDLATVSTLEMRKAPSSASLAEPAQDVVLQSLDVHLNPDIPSASSARKKPAEHEGSIPLPEMVTGPWGGRRWVPKSKTFPRRAQPLRWFRVAKNKHPDMSIMGSGRVPTTRPPLVQNLYSQQIHQGSFKCDSTTRSAVDPQDATNPPFAGSEELKAAATMYAASEEDFPKPWSDAGSPLGEEQGDDGVCKLRGTGVWMSSMFLGSIHMHNDQLAIATEVRRGTNGRGKPWLASRTSSHAHSGLSQKQNTTPRGVTGFRSVDAVRATVPLAMMRNPAVKFDKREVQAPTRSLHGAFEAEEEADGVFIRHPQRVLPLSARGAPTETSSRAGTQSHRQGAWGRSDDRQETNDATNTFLTNLPEEYADFRSGAHTARVHGGNQTERSRGSKTARQGDIADMHRRKARMQYLSINAGKSVGDFYKPRALNPGWNSQDFRPSISSVREARPRRLLRNDFPQQSDSVQLASLCISFHTCQTVHAILAAVQRAVHVVVGGSECILLRRCGEDAVCSYDADSSSSSIPVELGVGVVGSALISAFPITWNIFDENLVLDVADVSVGIRDMGMIFTAPLRKPIPAEARQTSLTDWTLQAPFGAFLVQRMFGSFDKGETEVLNVITDHASTALSKFLGGEGEYRPSPDKANSSLGYPVLENILSLQRDPSYDFVETRLSSSSSKMDGSVPARSPRPDNKSMGPGFVRRPCIE